MSRSTNETMEMIDQAHVGSSEALGRLLDRCRGYLLRIAGDGLDPRLQAKGGASDIVQDTFLEAQRDFHEFRGASEPELLAWLRHRLQYRMSKFARRHRHTARREVPLDGGGSCSAMGPTLVDDQPSPSECALAGERDCLLEQAMERLPEDYRRVLELRHRQGLSFKAIGAILGRTPNSARKLWARAIERLKLDLRQMTCS